MFERVINAVRSIGLQLSKTWSGFYIIKLVLMYFYWQRVQEKEELGIMRTVANQRGERSRGVAEVGVDRRVTEESYWWIWKGDPACAGGEDFRCKKGNGSISPKQGYGLPILLPLSADQKSGGLLANKRMGWSTFTAHSTRASLWINSQPACALGVHRDLTDSGPAHL